MINSEDRTRKVLNLGRQGAESNSERNRRQGPTCKRGEDLEDERINSSSAAEEQRSSRDTISEMRVVLVV
jgi:hypothetical protein